MGLFNFLKPKRGPDHLLIDLIEHNADRIAQTEAKDRSEATYLAICLVVDDLMKRRAGTSGYDAVMRLLQGHYPEHANDVITYIAWSTGKIALKPEYEAELIARHQ